MNHLLSKRRIECTKPDNQNILDLSFQNLLLLKAGIVRGMKQFTYVPTTDLRDSRGRLTGPLVERYQKIWMNETIHLRYLYYKPGIQQGINPSSQDHDEPTHTDNITRYKYPCKLINSHRPAQGLAPWLWLHVYIQKPKTLCQFQSIPCTSYPGMYL